MNLFKITVRTLFISIWFTTLSAQNVSINDNNAPPALSAILDIQSTDKGVLVPRMSTTVRNGISAPATGLLVYDTDTKSFWYYDATSWVEISVGAWRIKGNALTDPATNFLGTTDDQTLKFRVNNTERMSLDNLGRLFLIGDGNNTAVGNQTLFNNTLGTENVAIGAFSLSTNQSGSYNSALGYKTLFANTDGNYNNALGFESMRDNTTGRRNVAMGHRALVANQTGNFNVAIGDEAMVSNQSGSANVAIGIDALYLSDSGYNLVAVGDSALYSNKGGVRNTAIGSKTLFSNKTGNNNTVVGFNTLSLNETGSSNTAIGDIAGNTNSSGSNNCFIGRNSGDANSIGNGNTFVGNNAGQFNVTGNTNTAIGLNAGPSNSTINLVNTTAIGNGAIVLASHQIRLGNDSISSICGMVNFTTCSDARFKTNIKQNVPGLDFITKLRPVTYQFDKQKLNGFRTKGTIDSQTLAPTTRPEEVIYTGFLAQEVEQLSKSIGFDFSGVDAPDNESDIYGLRYAEFTVPLVKAVQEQQIMIEAQKTEIDALKAQLAAMQQQMLTILGELKANKQENGK